MKLTKYGFNLTLFGASSFLSVLGIVVSIIGVIGSIVFFVLGSIFPVTNKTGRDYRITLYATGAVILILVIPYLIMWILLKIKTSKKDIPGIEKIGKIYTYVSGSLEIIAMIARIYISSYDLHQLATYGTYSGFEIVYIIGAAIYLVFACLKIHGVRVENNKLIETYIGFRYGLFALHMIAFIIMIIYYKAFLTSLFVFGIHFILDIGLTVILHSIRVNRENTAGTENAMNKI